MKSALSLVLALPLLAASCSQGTKPAPPEGAVIAKPEAKVHGKVAVGMGTRPVGVPAGRPM